MRRSSQTESSTSSQRAAVSADRVVALPRLQGAPIDGLPQTVHGFIPVDSHCRVHGVADVFAAGDITSFTVKQGGIATQQADAAAEAIAAAAGASVTPKAFRPVLRGLLLTGRQPRYLRRELSVQPEHDAGRLLRAALVASGEDRRATIWRRSLRRWSVSRPPRPSAFPPPKRFPSKWSSIMRRSKG